MTTRKQGQESGNETPLTGEHSTVQGQNALRLKVAELCPRIKMFALGGWHWFDGIEWHTCVYNDPLRCLNTSAEMEKTIRGGSRGAYFANLGLVTGQAIQPTGWYDAFLLGTATAEQRCRAFVATMEGKEK